MAIKFKSSPQANLVTHLARPEMKF